MPIEGRYSNLFSENISIQTVTTVENINKFREQYISERMVQWTDEKKMKLIQTAFLGHSAPVT